MDLRRSPSWTRFGEVEREEKGTQMGELGYPSGTCLGPWWEVCGTKWEGSGTEVGKWGYWDGDSLMVRTEGKR